MGRLRVLNSSGDRELTWSQERTQAGEEEALVAVREAERIFAEERARGALAFRIPGSGPAERLESFDPAIDEMILIPRVVGG